MENVLAVENLDSELWPWYHLALKYIYIYIIFIYILFF